jgi:molecular chaperone DnaJ
MDLYALLGLNRSATSVEIERAYRRLARRFHPGVNPGDRVAVDRYRQVSQAYGVLSDDARRGEYDRGAERDALQDDAEPVAFDGFDFSAAAEGPLAATFSELFADVFQDAAREATTPTRGSDLELAARVSFVDAARGTAVALSVTRQDRCPGCLGDGRVARAPALCPACRGEGARRWARGHMVFSKACDACEGTGRVSSDVCRGCSGAGIVPRTEVVTIAVPAGIEPGARIAVPGRGHAGARGGPAGDLYVTIDVADHPHFRRTGRDLFLTLPVAVHEAALGARVRVPTLDGHATVRVPPGTQAGTRVRLVGQGIPATHPADPFGPGDLLLEIRIVLPTALDERSKELLREFGRLNAADVRGALFERA